MEYKVAILVHKALSTVAPSYICELLSPYVPLHQLRTAEMRLFSVPGTAFSIGDRAFSVVGPRHFNSLSDDLKKNNDISAFRKKLKTYLFQEVYQTSWLLFFFLIYYFSGWDSSTEFQFYFLFHEYLLFTLLLPL